MPADLFAVAVNWFGPSRSLMQARRLGVENDVDEFLYVGYEVSGNERSYVGISKDVSSRFRTAHHVFGQWQANTFELWIGIVASQAEPGRKPSSRPKVHSEALNFAESMTAYFVATTENQRKNKTPPKRSGILYNRWFKLEAGWPARRQRPHQNWPEFIEYDVERRSGKVAYFGGALQRFDNL